MLGKVKMLAVSLITLMAVAQAQTATDQITVAGGFTPIPLMIEAGKYFIKQFPQYKPPHILYNDTTVGFELFCAGGGLDTPSINTGTREMNAAERKQCAANGVKEIIHFKLGHDALVVAQLPGGKLNGLKKKDLFLAIAKEVPDPKDNSKLIPNPYLNWKDINPELPNVKIQVLAPEKAIGLYRTFSKGILQNGCKEIESFKLLEKSNPEKFQAVCKNTRSDNAYTEYTKTPEVIQALKANPDSLGIISLTNAVKERMKVISLDNIDPNFVTVSREIYDLTFAINIFVKKPHIVLIPGFTEYLNELTSEAATGTTGYFYKMGVIPLRRSERDQVRADVQALKIMAP